MSIFKWILCPVDFSDCSARALGAAVALAKTARRPLKVLYAVHLDVPAYVNESAQVEITKQLVASKLAAKDALSAWVASHVAPGTDIEYEIVEQPPVEAIRQTAQSASGCWIVMGTHGRTGLKRLLLGSVTERTLREAGVPVLTIPPESQEGN